MKFLSSSGFVLAALDWYSFKKTLHFNPPESYCKKKKKKKKIVSVYFKAQSSIPMRVNRKKKSAKSLTTQGFKVLVAFKMNKQQH